jgi:DNA processing protein
LITADFALEDGREVLAVPGEITSGLSHGTNALLRLGATPVTCAGDVLEAIGLEPAARESPAPEGDAATVLAAVAATPSTADEVARRTTLEAGQVAAAVVELELAGIVTVVDGVVRPSSA